MPGAPHNQDKGTVCGDDDTPLSYLIQITVARPLTVTLVFLQNAGGERGGGPPLPGRD